MMIQREVSRTITANVVAFQVRVAVAAVVAAASTPNHE